MKTWHFQHKGHNIEITNGLSGERLIVDGELQDERIGPGSRSRLYGKIRSGDGEGEKIKVSLGGWFSISCIALVDDKEVFRP